MDTKQHSAYLDEGRRRRAAMALASMAVEDVPGEDELARQLAEAHRTFDA